ncbi:cysteine-rich receptor-like protein kinase 10 [Cryptomeria japonica]|uniref:cysteine-rich receptor-like protein kinase 10 n=1 Tax=Cryptomeria japonica TaxID=3369 RepID=UPI0027D9D2A0|nr:cysteine-rich receptor-like protein kinase 10 [Cryptomeria japonica]
MKYNSLASLSYRGTTFLPTLVLLLFVINFPSVICTYVWHTCDNSSTFTNGSTYSTNLNLVINDLYLNAPKSSGFNTSSHGQSPSKVYGLLQCTGNISVERCSKCAVEANNTIHDLCPNDIGGKIWLDDCFMRYWNSNFISTLDTTGISLLNTVDISKSRDAFENTTSSLLSNLSDKAYIPANKGFAAGTAKYNATGILYGLVQCWRDISIQDCRICLAKARANLSDCCSTKGGAQFQSGSCKARFEIYYFFRSADSPTPSPSPSPSPSPEESIHPPTSTPEKTASKTIPITLGLVGGIILALFISLIIFRKRIKSLFFKEPVTVGTPNEATEIHGFFPETGLMQDQNLIYSLEALVEATENFHDNNKLGEGGFGAVYKGRTRDGNEIAVKKLSARSKQGKKEFMNEVKLVANVQHRNLARLLGCCVEGNERLLVYDYFPNKSLDTFLFDPEKRKELDWQKRYNIIIGISRGLLYLHQESQLRIIHRDIKANNILLDHKLNPKIADFGLAKLFPEDKTHIHTRVAGTYGYMPPEYAMRGQLSVKVDVYSFGVVLLEIVSGRKNNDNHLPNDMQHLVEWAWTLFHGGNALNMVDSEASGVSQEQVLRCIHVGLLCVQANAALRPVMSDVITMISSSSVTLPNPSKPVFVSTGESHSPKPEAKSMSSWGIHEHKIITTSQIYGATTSSSSGIPSVNDASITELETR